MCQGPARSRRCGAGKPRACASSTRRPASPTPIGAACSPPSNAIASPTRAAACCAPTAPQALPDVDRRRRLDQARRRARHRARRRRARRRPRRGARRARRHARRGIASALVQRHVDGDVLKFYAVRGRFFAAFRRRRTCRARRGARTPPCARSPKPAAAALELEVFGGDCVRDRQQRLWLIDLNDWPSYAPCRSGAAEAIASYLQSTDGNHVKTAHRAAARGCLCARPAFACPTHAEQRATSRPACSASRSSPSSPSSAAAAAR